MANALSKIVARAKQLRKAHPGKSWKACVAQSSAEYRRGAFGYVAKKKPAAKKKVVKHYRQTGSSDTKRDAERSARKPGKRKSAQGNTYYEYRKNRSDVPGKLTGAPNKDKLLQITDASLKKVLRDRMLTKLGALLLKRDITTSRRDKRKLSKEISIIRAEIKKLL